MTNISENLPSFIVSIRPFINQYGYFGVASLLLLESIGLPLPGETVLITAAFFAAVGSLNIIYLILLGVIVAVIGDNIAYFIGVNGGRTLVQKYGRYISLNEVRFKKLEAFFNRQGSKIVLFARFFEGLRQLNGLIAGISNMKWKTFLSFNIIGASIWVTFWSLIGYYSGNNIRLMLRYQEYLSIALGIFVVAFLLRFILKRNRQKGT